MATTGGEARDGELQHGIEKSMLAKRESTIGCELAGLLLDEGRTSCAIHLIALYSTAPCQQFLRAFVCCQLADAEILEQEQKEIAGEEAQEEEGTELAEGKPAGEEEGGKQKRTRRKCRSRSR
ncbi:unnamed protein product [Calypogeia fissa]